MDLESIDEIVSFAVKEIEGHRFIRLSPLLFLAERCRRGCNGTRSSWFRKESVREFAVDCIGLGCHSGTISDRSCSQTTNASHNDSLVATTYMFVSLLPPISRTLGTGRDTSALASETTSFEVSARARMAIVC